MCGICGIWYFDMARVVDAAQLHSMNERLRHRGPDDAGIFCEGSVGLGVSRLSIVDALGSRQPLMNEDGTLVLVANGEIYNYRQLRSNAHHYRTAGDLETILHLYEDAGRRCVDPLRGMFAFAIWDVRQRQLTLAVDRFGKKPLYYFHDSEKIVFASELKALRCLTHLPRNLSFEALDEYLSVGYVTAPRTIFRDIHRMSPGQIMTFRQDGSVESERYWLPEFAASPEWERRSSDDLAAELRVLLEESVRLRLNADDPPGAFLSGGIDSTSVVALMTEISGAPVKTFSLGFADSAYDESAYARSAAAHFRTNHHCEIVTESAVDLLPMLVRQFDEPFADSSMIPMYLVSRFARAEVKAVLSGDGGDEVFGGYHQHLYAYRQQFLEAKITPPLRPIMRRGAEKLPRRVKGVPYLAALDQPPECWLTNGFFSARQRNLLFSRDARERTVIGGFERSRHEVFERVVHLDRLSQVQSYDLTHYLAGDILVKVDRASMFASLEVRCPLLDHTIFEFMAHVPPDVRMSVQSGKLLLRKALTPLLPRFVRQRRKQGFSVPQAEWLRQSLKPLVNEIATMGLLGDLFDSTYIQQLAAEHFAGIEDHKDRLWALLCLDLWVRDF